MMTARHSAPRPYVVLTTAGRIEPMAWSPAHAISQAQELAGPGATIIRWWQSGDW